MVGRVTIFSHWENWWKVKAAERSGREEGRRSLQPLSPQPVLTGSGPNDVLLPVHLQAEAVHHAVGQQPVDGQLQQQGQPFPSFLFDIVDGISPIWRGQKDTPGKFSLLCTRVRRVKMNIYRMFFFCPSLGSVS